MIFDHPYLSDKSVEEVADLVAVRGTPEHQHYVTEVLPDTRSDEYSDNGDRFLTRQIAKLLKSGSKVAKERCRNEALVQRARLDLHWRFTFEIYNIGTEPDFTVHTKYTPYSLLEGEPWPTSWWFRFAQTNWGKSRWHMVPDFPPALLALMGYDLISTSRWMGDDVMSMDERVEFVTLLWKWEQQGKGAFVKDEESRLKDLLERSPYGGELPILDIDVSKIYKDVPEGQIEAVRLERAQAASSYAVGTTAVWRQITGITPRWTVTNDRGGLHGLNLPLPPHVRHPDLLRVLMGQIANRCPSNGVPYKAQAKDKETGAPVTLDLTAYNKYSRGHGGMWRVPLCSKPESGSLPQAPVSEHAATMPWLSAITPEALGSDWALYPPAYGPRLLADCAAHRKAEDEREISRGNAYREPATGRVRRVRKQAVQADADLGSTEFTETAKMIVKHMPGGVDEGLRRHNVRLAVAGWFYKSRLSKEAALATLLACGGNKEDSTKVIETTYARGDRGEDLAGLNRVGELLGEAAKKDLGAAYQADVEERDRDTAEKLAASSVDPDQREQDEDDHAPEEEDEGPRAAPQRREDLASSISRLGQAAQTVVRPAQSVASTETSAASDATRPATATVTPASGASSTTTTSSSTATATKTVTIEKASRSLKNPLALQYLFLMEAKLRIDEARNWWTAPDVGGSRNALVNTKRELLAIERQMSDKIGFILSTVGQVLAFAGVSRVTASATATYGGKTLSQLATSFRCTQDAIRAYRRGKELPRILSLSFLRKMLGYQLYSSLLEALADDLKTAPFDVRERVFIDQGRSSEERDLLRWCVTGIKGNKLAYKAPEFAKHAEYKRIDGVYRCGRLANYKICPIHDEVGVVPIVCDSEVGCPSCRAKLHNLIGEWITSFWIEERYVVFHWKAPTTPVWVRNLSTRLRHPLREFTEVPERRCLGCCSARRRSRAC